MMKRLMALLTALLLTMTALPALAAEVDLPRERIDQVIARLLDHSQDEYLASIGVPETLRQKAVAWSENVSDKPRLIVRANLNDSALMLRVRTNYMMEPDVVRLEAESSMQYELVSYLYYNLSLQGSMTDATYAQMIELNNLLGASMIYGDEAIPVEEINFLYFVFYEDAVPLLIFGATQEHAVTMNCWYMPSENLARCKNAGQVAMWLSANGSPMTCKSIPLE